MVRTPDIYPRPDMLATPEGTLRYAARLGIVLYVTEEGRAKADQWERADDALLAAIERHRDALRRSKTEQRDRNVADQAQMWRDGGPPWAQAKRTAEAG